MKLIAGLGNPGREYERTAHNVGFDVVDLLCSRLGGSWQSVPKFQARVAKVVSGSTQILLVQPQTYMNESGRAVGPLARYYRIAPADVIAVSDDADLPPGHLRVRPSGNTGGHRGLASLIECLGTNVFPRVRVGIGHGSDGRSLADHVLSRLPETVRNLIDQAVPVAADAALFLTGHTPADAMNRFNAFQPVQPAGPASAPAPAPLQTA